MGQTCTKRSTNGVGDPASRETDVWFKEGADKYWAHPPRLLEDAATADGGPRGGVLLAASGQRTITPFDIAARFEANGAPYESTGAGDTPRAFLFLSVPDHNVVVVSVVILLYQSAVFPLFSYLAPLFGKFGQWILMAQSLSSVLTCVFSSTLIEYFGERNMMKYPGVVYIVFGVLVTIHSYVPRNGFLDLLCIASSFVSGPGGNLLLIAAVTVVAKCSTPTHLGRRMGFFNAVAATSILLGNVASYFWVTEASVGAMLVSYVALMVSALGASFLVLPFAGESGLPRAPPPPAHEAVGPEEPAPLAFPSRAVSDSEPVQPASRGFLSSTVRLGYHPQMLLLLPLMGLVGCENSYYTGSFTQLFSEAGVAVVMSVLGIGEILGGAVIGLVIDCAGTTTALWYSCALISTALGLTMIMASGESWGAVGVLADTPTLGILAGLFFGLGDSSLNTVMLSAVAQAPYGGGVDTAEAFAVALTYMQAGGLIMFAVTIPVEPTDHQTGLLPPGATLGLVVLALVAEFVRRQLERRAVANAAGKAVMSQVMRVVSQSLQEHLAKEKPKEESDADSATDRAAAPATRPYF